MDLSYTPGLLATEAALLASSKVLVEGKTAEGLWSVRYPCLSETYNAVDVVGFRMATGQPVYNTPVHTHEKMTPHAIKLCRMASRMPADDPDRVGCLRDAAFIFERLVRTKTSKDSVAHMAMRYIVVDGNPAHQHTASAMLALSFLSAQDCPGGNPEWAALMADIIAFPPPAEVEDHVLTSLTALNTEPASETPIFMAMKGARARAMEILKRRGPDGELTMGLSRRTYDHICKYWANHGCFDMALRRLTAFIALFIELIDLSKRFMKDFDAAMYEDVKHLTAVVSAMCATLPREGASYKPPPRPGAVRDHWDYDATKRLGLLMNDTDAKSIFFGSDMGDSNVIQGMIDTVADILPPHVRFLAYAITRCTSYMKLDFALLPIFNALYRDYDVGDMEMQQALLRRVRAYRSYGLSEMANPVQLDPFLKMYCTPDSKTGAGVSLLASVADDRAILCGGTEPVAGWGDLVDPYLQLMGDSVPAFLMDLFNRMIAAAAALYVSGTSNIDTTETVDMFGVLSSIGIFISCSPDLLTLESAPESAFSTRRCKVRQLTAIRKPRVFRAGLGRRAGRGRGQQSHISHSSSSSGGAGAGGAVIPSSSATYQTDVRDLVERYDRLKQARVAGPTEDDLRFIAEREKGFKTIHRQLHGCTNDPSDIRALQAWSVWPVILSESDYTVGSLVSTSFVLPDSMSTEVYFMVADYLCYASSTISRLQRRPLVLAVCARAVSPGVDSTDGKAMIEIVVLPTTLSHEAATMPILPTESIDPEHPLQRWAASADRHARNLRPHRQDTRGMRPVQMKHLPPKMISITQQGILQPAFRVTSDNASDLSDMWRVDGLAAILGFSLVIPPCTSADYIPPIETTTAAPTAPTTSSRRRPTTLSSPRSLSIGESDDDDDDGADSLGSFFDEVDGVVPEYVVFKSKQSVGGVVDVDTPVTSKNVFAEDELMPLQESFGVVVGLQDARRRRRRREERRERGRAFDQAVARAAVPSRDPTSTRSQFGRSVGSGARKRGTLPPPPLSLPPRSQLSQDVDEDDIESMSALKRRRQHTTKTPSSVADASSLLTTSTSLSVVAARRQLAKELKKEDLSGTDLQFRFMQVLNKIPHGRIMSAFRSAGIQSVSQLHTKISVASKLEPALVATLILFVSSKTFVTAVRSTKKFASDTLYKTFLQMQPDPTGVLDKDDVRVWLLRGELPRPAEEAP